MELPQPRPIGTQGRKATHDFLSLYSTSTSHVQQDPTHPHGGYLKTQDLLQPLEGVGKKEEKKSVVTSGVERPAEHFLPGGIGTYSISYFNQRIIKQPELGSLFTSTTANDQNSNCTSYTGTGFTLWDESSAIKKGKTGKENIHILREAGVGVAKGQWTSLLEKQTQPSADHMHNVATFSSFSSSQPSSSHKNPSFMDMITSAKNDQEEDDDDEDDEFVIKKEPSSHPKGKLSVKVEAKIIDRKPNTPRSKHSATEQRRRSKINDRFQKLREIIPNSDQKRDKASFLLEVIDYIQFLQEKVNRYESSYNVWNHEPSSSKMMQWKKCEGLLDHTQRANADSRPDAKFEEKKAASVSPINGQNLVDSDISTATTLKQTQQPNIFSFGITAATSPVSPMQPSDTDKTITWSRSIASASKIKDQELTIDSGTINISTVYSQRLLNTLTQALHSSGVDLSQASISVQIDLGKRANCIPHASTLPTKDDDVAASAGEEVGHALKRLRTS